MDAQTIDPVESFLQSGAQLPQAAGADPVEAFLSSTQAPSTPPAKGFGARISEDWHNRYDATVPPTLLRMVTGQTPVVGGTMQMIGNGLYGGMNDVLREGFNSLPDMTMIPDSEYQKPTSSPVADAVDLTAAGRNIGDILMNTRNSASRNIGDFLTTYPNFAANASAIANIATAAPALDVGGNLMANARRNIAAPIAKGSNEVVKAVQPLFDSGRQQLAANILRASAQDPEAAMANIQSAPEFIPGSIPTAGVASNDYGLMDLERTLRQQPGNPFGSRIAEQNTARNATMNAVAGTEGDINQAKEFREKLTAPLYENAANVPIAPNALKPVLDTIDTQIQAAGAQSDLGKTLLAYKAKLQGSLPSMQPIDTGLLDESGAPISRPNFENTQQGPLSQIYREERDQLQKTGMQPGAYGSSVRSVVKPINYQLGKALEEQSPDLQMANKEYASQSGAINNMQNMQDLTKSLTGTTQDTAGNYFYEPARVARLMKAGGLNTEQGWKDLPDALNTNQFHYVQNLQSDLARDNLLNSPAVKPVGSNTFANFSGTGALHSKIASMIEGVPIIGKMYKGASEDIKNKLIAAYLSPELATQMLAQGKP